MLLHALEPSDSPAQVVARQLSPLQLTRHSRMGLVQLPELSFLSSEQVFAHSNGATVAGAEDGIPANARLQQEIRLSSAAQSPFANDGYARSLLYLCLYSSLMSRRLGRWYERSSAANASPAETEGVTRDGRGRMYVVSILTAWLIVSQPPS
jgi:hypothetical protein